MCRRPLIVAEVKAGHAADKASPKVIADWIEQTDTEAVHAGAVLGVLIVARKYRNPRDWDAWMRAADSSMRATGITPSVTKPRTTSTPRCMTVAS